MIGTWSFKIKRRTPTYTRRCKQVRRRTGAPRRRVDNGRMLFDQPRELPVATLRSARTSITAQVAGALQQWLAARWDFLRPRMVPVIVAAIGMVLVINAVNYLAQPPAPIAASMSASNEPAPQPAYGFRIKLVLQQ